MERKYVSETAIVSESGDVVHRQFDELSEEGAEFLQQLNGVDISDWSAVKINPNTGHVGAVSGKALELVLRAVNSNQDVILITPRNHGRSMVKAIADKAREITEKRAVHEERRTLDSRLANIMRDCLSVDNFDCTGNVWLEDDVELERSHTLKVEENRKIGGKHAQPFWHKKRW